MADFMHCQAEDLDDGNSSSYDNDCNDWFSSFIDDANYEENPSDYYGFANASRAVESAEADAFPELDVKQFHNENVEAQIYCFNSDKEASDKENNFASLKEKIKDFNKNLKIPLGKDNLDLLIYTISIRFDLKKLKSWENIEMKNQSLFSLDKSKSNLRLDLDYQDTETQCFPTNDILAKGGYLLRIYESKKSFAMLYMKQQKIIMLIGNF